MAVWRNGNICGFLFRLQNAKLSHDNTHRGIVALDDECKEAVLAMAVVVATTTMDSSIVISMLLQQCTEKIL